MRFCFDCQNKGYRMGRDCMCRCRNELTEREVQNRDLERIREDDEQDNVVIEESDLDAASSLAVARQIVNRLRNKLLSRLLAYFKAISRDGNSHRRDLEIQKEDEDRNNDRYGEI